MTIFQCIDSKGTEFQPGDRVIVTDCDDTGESVPYRHLVIGKRGRVETDGIFYFIVLDDPKVATPHTALGEGWRSNGWAPRRLTFQLESEEVTSQTPIQEVSSGDPRGYRRTEEGFLTNEDNWTRWLL